ncbi:1-deoxy-D-xylulose-5-phosphate reductoisomerase [PVC group bacterium (ex Bugula neritina AB1)]|nr:1-deoxy-D-xylulose-5-phosphate reductoisomerase [PVC group bacterium (ex Bugula neritina AB1)]
MKRIAILGSTGSVGKNTVEVALEHPDEFKIVALAVDQNIIALKDQLERVSPEAISVGDELAKSKFKELMPSFKGDILLGIEGVCELAKREDVDWLMISLPGSLGLYPLMEGLKSEKHIAFVNKEALVMGGAFVMDEVKKRGVQFIPVDSEHSAIYQCLIGENMEDVDRLILTSSGGPFRKCSLSEMANKKASEAVNHPRWNMGPKISVDSATLMNKGLEVIEAYWLFGKPLDSIDIMIHPESVIHSMVEFVDGSFKASLAVSDMKIPILYALSYPKRLFLENVDKLDLVKWKTLSFEEVDRDKFPAVDLCYEACRLGGTYPVALNVANEVAVDAFLKEKIGFLDIVKLIQDILDKHQSDVQEKFEDVIETALRVRSTAERWVKEKCLYV